MVTIQGISSKLIVWICQEASTVVEADIMVSAARNALVHVMDLQPADRVLIVSDTHSCEVSQAFADAARAEGCSVVTVAVNENARPLRHVPPFLKEQLEGKTVVLNIIKALPEEIPFRIEWIFAVEERKNIRLGHMPGITEAMLTTGSIDVDYQAMRMRAEKVIERLQNATSIRITTKHGTDITLGVRGRPFLHDVRIEPGHMGNLPCGEIYCAPEETHADGTVVIDASIGDIGIVTTPLTVTLREGKVVRFESRDSGLAEQISGLSQVDDDAKVIGELGIGINPRARITGNMLEDEKAQYTAHVAFGNNADFGGGGNHSAIHRDFLFYHPTLDVVYVDGSCSHLMRDGVFLFETRSAHRFPDK